MIPLSLFRNIPVILCVIGFLVEISAVTTVVTISLPSDTGMVSTLVTQTSRDLLSVITYNASSAYQTSTLSKDILPLSTSYTWVLYRSDWTTFINTASTSIEVQEATRKTAETDISSILNNEAINTKETSLLGMVTVSDIQSSVYFTSASSSISEGAIPVISSISEGAIPVISSISEGAIPVISSISEGAIPVISSISEGAIPVISSISDRALSTTTSVSKISETTVSEFSKSTGFSTYMRDYSSTLKNMISSVFSTSINYTSDTPDRTSVISYRSGFNFITTTDNNFLTESYQTDSKSILGSLQTQTGDLKSKSSISGGSNSIITMSSELLRKSSEVLRSSFSMDTFTLGQSQNEVSNSQGFSTDQVTPTLSSFSSTYNLPVISTKQTFGSISSENVQYSSEPIFSTVSSHIQSTDQNVIGTSVYSLSDTIGLTTPSGQGVTSGFETMSVSSASPTVNPVIGDLQGQIDDLKATENRYMTAVIVLVLIIVLLIVLIILYGIRRRKFYLRKQLRLRGIDEDLLEENGTTMRHHQKNYFDVGQTDNLRIGGRISTASLGSRDSEPIHLLQSFNKNKDNPFLETAEEATDEVFDVDKIGKVKDEEL